MPLFNCCSVIVVASGFTELPSSSGLKAVISPCCCFELRPWCLIWFKPEGLAHPLPWPTGLGLLTLNYKGLKGRHVIYGFPIKGGGFYDHVHLLDRIPAKIAVSDFVGQLKASTSKHINDTSGVIRKFGWQDGYGAFTVSVSVKDQVVAYIENQMEHHSEKTFEEEHLKMLEKHDVEYDQRYVFD